MTKHNTSEINGKSEDLNADQHDQQQKTKLDVKVKPAGKENPGVTVSGSAIHSIIGAYPKRLSLRFKTDDGTETPWIEFRGSRERLDLQNNPTGIYGAYYSGNTEHPFDMSKLTENRGERVRIVGFDFHDNNKHAA